MGNLLGSWRFKEPSTVEECDSTWGSDSESDEPAAEDDSGISDSISPAESDRAAGDTGDTSPQVNREFCSLHAMTEHSCHRQWTKLTRPGHGKGNRPAPIMLCFWCDLTTDAKLHSAQNKQIFLKKLKFNAIYRMCILSHFVNFTQMHSHIQAFNPTNSHFFIVTYYPDTCTKALCTLMGGS